MATGLWISITIFVFIGNNYAWPWQNQWVFAGCMLLLGWFAVTAILAFLTYRERNKAKERAEAALAAEKAALLDPSLITAGLEIGRAIGWRRVDLACRRGAAGDRAGEGMVLARRAGAAGRRELARRHPCSVKDVAGKHHWRVRVAKGRCLTLINASDAAKHDSGCSNIRVVAANWYRAREAEVASHAFLLEEMRRCTHSN